MRGHRISLIAVGLAILSVLVTAPGATAAPTRTSAQMCCMGGGTHLGGAVYGSSAYSAVGGHADYWSWNSGRHREFHIGLWSAGKLAGKTLTVYAAGHNIGTMRVGSGGNCDFHHDTNNGQNVPTLSSGATVTVKTSTGALVASGTLHRMSHM